MRYRLYPNLRSLWGCCFEAKICRSGCCCYFTSNLAEKYIFPICWAPEPKLDSWQLCCPCITFTLCSLPSLSFAGYANFSKYFAQTLRSWETEQTVWGNQSSKRVEADDEDEDEALCVIWVDFSGMLFGLRLRIRRLCDCDSDWDRVGDGVE